MSLVYEDMDNQTCVLDPRSAKVKRKKKNREIEVKSAIDVFSDQVSKWQGDPVRYPPSVVLPIDLYIYVRYNVMAWHGYVDDDE